MLLHPTLGLRGVVLGVASEFYEEGKAMEESGLVQERADKNPYTILKWRDGFEMEFSEEEVGTNYWTGLRSALESGDHANALAYFNTGTTNHQSCGALVFKAFHLQLLSEREEALRVYDKAVVANQKDPRAWLGRGALLCDMGDYAAALEDVTEALKLDEHDACAHSLRGDVQLRLAQQCSQTYRADRARSLSFAAERSYRTALDRSPQSIPTLLKLGQLLSSRGQVYQSAAVTVFQEALELEPDNVAVLIARGHAYFQLERFNEALIDFEHVVSLEPDRASEWHSHGACLYKLNRLEEALASYDRSLSIDSEMPLSWLERGLTLGRLARDEEALESFDRAISLQREGIPTLVGSMAMEGRGRSLKQLGRHLEARQSLREARRTRRRAKRLLKSNDRLFLLVLGVLSGVIMLLAAPILWATVVRAGQFSTRLPIVLLVLGSLLTPSCAWGLRRLTRQLAELPSQAPPSKE